MFLCGQFQNYRWAIYVTITNSPVGDESEREKKSNNISLALHNTRSTYREKETKKTQRIKNNKQNIQCLDNFGSRSQT